MMRIIFGMMAIYLVLMAALALKYDWQFFMNDAIALSLFAVLVIGLFIVDPPHRRHR